MSEGGVRYGGARLPEAVILRGESVRLEPLRAARHAEEIWAAIRGVDGLWAWLFDGPFDTEEDFGSLVRANEAAVQARFFAIVPLRTGRAAGWLSLMRMEPAHGVIEVGNILLSPELQRTREATEAQYLLARYVFDELGYRRYEWKCNAGNGPSRRAAERLGFKFEGIFRQHMVVKGANRDTAWFAMMDHEWVVRRAAFERWLRAENFDETGRQRVALGG